MTHGNKTLARLARPHAERAISGLAAIVDDCTQSAEARMAAARTRAVTVEAAPEPGADPRPARRAHGQSRKMARRLTSEAFERWPP